MCVCDVYHEEDLLQPLDAVFVPRRADVDAARLTANQMLRQQHDEALTEEKKCFKDTNELTEQVSSDVFLSHYAESELDSTAVTEVLEQWMMFMLGILRLQFESKSIPAQISQQKAEKVCI